MSENQGSMSDAVYPDFIKAMNKESDDCELSDDETIHEDQQFSDEDKPESHLDKENVLPTHGITEVGNKIEEGQVWKQRIALTPSVEQSVFRTDRAERPSPSPWRSDIFQNSPGKPVYRRQQTLTVIEQHKVSPMRRKRQHEDIPGEQDSEMSTFLPPPNPSKPDANEDSPFLPLANAVSPKLDASHEEILLALESEYLMPSSPPPLLTSFGQGFTSEYMSDLLPTSPVNVRRGYLPSTYKAMNAEEVTLE